MRDRRPKKGIQSLRWFFLLVSVLAVAGTSHATIRYTIRMNHAADHTFDVEVSVPNAPRSVTVALPAWNALYQIRDFAYRMRDLRASSGLSPGTSSGASSRTSDAAHAVRKLDKETWRIDAPPDSSHSGSSDMDIRYSIEWDDPGPFNSQLNLHHAFMNLAEILVYIPERRAEDTSVSFADLPGDWKVAVQLAPAGSPDGGPGSASGPAATFVASSYDAMVDAPAEAGKFDSFEFNNQGARFRVVVDGTDWKKAVLQDDLRRITTYEMELMGGPPFTGYTFFFHIGKYSDVGGGGMEHSFSTTIGAESEGSAAAIAAHEFFHVWNVKRIRPQALEPVDYTKEQYTRALWFAEGVTSTYAAFALERSGLWSKGQFYSDLGTQITQLQSRPARSWQSVEESSLDAWLEGFDDYNKPDRSISYYNKGQIVGLLLDLAIRDATDNRKSLDDVLRRMYAEYAQQGKFYNESEGIRSVVEEVAGKSFEDFFSRYVTGTDEIPYDSLLGAAGLELKMTQNSDIASAAGMREDEQVYSIGEVPHPTERQKRIREGMLRGVTQ